MCDNIELYNQLNSINTLENDIILNFTRDYFNKFYNIIAPNKYNDTGTWLEWNNISTYKLDDYDAYREIKTSYDIYKIVEFLKNIPYFNNKTLNLCDIGCGIGGFMYLCNNIGLNTYGIEYLEDNNKEYHIKMGLNVKYGDFFKIDLSFLKEMDIIYLYRPIKDTEQIEKILNIIYKNTKDDVVILFNFLFDSDNTDNYNRINIINQNINIGFNEHVMFLLKK